MLLCCCWYCFVLLLLLRSSWALASEVAKTTQPTPRNQDAAHVEVHDDKWKDDPARWKVCTILYQPTDDVRAEDNKWMSSILGYPSLYFLCVLLLLLCSLQIAPGTGLLNFNRINFNDCMSIGIRLDVPSTTPSYYTALHSYYTALHSYTHTTLHYTALHSYYTSLHSYTHTTLHYTSLQRQESTLILHCTTLHCSVKTSTQSGTIQNMNAMKDSTGSRIFLDIL